MNISKVRSAFLTVSDLDELVLSDKMLRCLMFHFKSRCWSRQICHILIVVVFEPADIFSMLIG